MADGLINSNTLDPTKPSLNPDAATTASKSFGYTPDMGTVNLGTDTVSGQLDAILSKDNPLTARSNARVAEAYNSRGLINSSMATGAAEAARIDTALPIAQADASTFSAQRLTNQAASNTAAQSNANAANNFSLDAQQAKEKADLLQQSGKQDVTLQGLKGDQAIALQNVTDSNKQLLQASPVANAAMSETQKYITDILNNGDLSADQQQAAINHQIQYLQARLAVAGGIADADLGGLLDWTTGAPSGSTVTPPPAGTQTPAPGTKVTTPAPAPTPGAAPAPRADLATLMAGNPTDEQMVTYLQSHPTTRAQIAATFGPQGATLETVNQWLTQHPNVAAELFA